MTKDDVLFFFKLVDEGLHEAITKQYFNIFNVLIYRDIMTIFFKLQRELGNTVLLQ